MSVRTLHEKSNQNDCQTYDDVDAHPTTAAAADVATAIQVRMTKYDDVGDHDGHDDD